MHEGEKVAKKDKKGKRKYSKSNPPKVQTQSSPISASK
jgi:hypothetical protein